ncbi:MAG: hisS [Bacillales bacterium]|jgi:histidyl-tRNA synthetase|nr:hisS [Bacillales bacterium]
MSNLINRPRGTNDVLPGESELWQYIENKAREICSSFNYKEIRTPIFEHTELFQRGVGDTTDIVQKEMYSFTTRGEKSVTLRPEGTASVCRAYVENKLFGLPSQPVKLYYIGPMFRYERPQAGRMRQFVQFGVEVLGSNDPAVDVEIMVLAMEFYRKLGLKNLKLVINSLGDVESRQAYRTALVQHFSPEISNFCEDCQSRLETNPLRILDCKKDHNHPLIKSAPRINQFYSDEARIYFEKVLLYLDELKESYVIDTTLVRGLDYYNHTAFEIMLDGEGFGSITTLCGGGRYNDLVEDLGGPTTPGIGFAMSIERLLLGLQAQNINLPISNKLDCYLIPIGDKAKIASTRILLKLRQAGIRADLDYLNRKMKTQFKEAERNNAKFVAIIGDEEVDKNTVQLKELETSSQEEVRYDDLVLYIKDRIKHL